MEVCLFLLLFGLLGEYFVVVAVDDRVLLCVLFDFFFEFMSTQTIQKKNQLPCFEPTVLTMNKHMCPL